MIKFILLFLSLSAFAYDPKVNDLVNQNFVVNPSFENAGTSGWSLGTGSFSASVSNGNASEGKVALKVTPITNAFDFSQTVSVIGISQKVIGLDYKIPSTCSGFKLEIFVDGSGTAQTTVLSTSLILDGIYHTIEIPTVASTSIKIKPSAATACTGDSYFDRFYVKSGIGTQALQLDNVYSAHIDGTASPSTVTKENKDWINGDCVRNTTGNYTCTFVTGIFSVAPNCSVASPIISASTRTAVVTSVSSSSMTIQAFDGSAGQNYALDVFCQKSGNDYLAASSSVYSQASANYDWTSYTPTITGLTSVSPSSNFCKYRKNGGNADFLCQVTITAPTAALASMTLPSGLAIDSSKIVLSSLNNAPSAVVGYGWGGNTQAFAPILASTASSTSLVYFGPVTTSTGNAITTPIGGSGVWSTGFVQTFSFSLPISGWSNASTIVGSFEKIEKCASVDECTDIYTATLGSTGTVLSSNVSGWISSASVASTSIFTINFKTGTFTTTPSCTVTASEGTSIARIDTSPSPSKDAIQVTAFSDSGVLTATRLNIHCGKQGADSKPKTAKIASSIGVPTVPGITTEAVDTFSVSYGATISTNCTAASTTCAYTKTSSPSVTLVHGTTNSGAYTVANGSTLYSILNCNVNAKDSTTGPAFATDTSCINCSSLTFTTVLYNNSGVKDSYGTVTCQGTR